MNRVQIIADSKNEFGQRLITAILTFPRYLLAEVNTHRMLSRNSASSRAIRFEKMVQSVQENPFIPFKWQKDHAGMQGVEYVTDKRVITLMEEIWLEGRDLAVLSAKKLHAHGITKQLCNRKLEPYMYHTALVSGTELENFFALRAEDGAEIHFQDLAYKFLEACNKSTPKQLKAGQWHIPFGDNFDEDEIYQLIKSNNPSGTYETPEHWHKFDELKVKIATVRAARISYAAPGIVQKHDYEADLKLHDRLASSGHWSSFEHCAQAMSADQFYSHVNGVIGTNRDSSNDIFNYEYYPYVETESEYIGFVGPNPNNGNRYGWCGNFQGFIQYRKMFDSENRRDSRLIQK